MIQPLRMPLLQFPQNSTSRTTSELLAEMVKPHELHQPGLQISSILSHYTETRQQMIKLALPGLEHYPNFLSVLLKMPLTPDNRKQFREHNAHIPKRWGGGFWSFSRL